MRIPAGELNQRVTFTREVRVRDGGGGFAVSAEEVAQAWARVRPSSVREIEKAGGVQGRTLYTVIIRRRSDLMVGTDMRISWRGLSLDIRGVLDEGPQEPFLPIIAEAGVPNPATV